MRLIALESGPFVQQYSGPNHEASATIVLSTPGTIKAWGVKGLSVPCRCHGQGIGLRTDQELNIRTDGSHV